MRVETIGQATLYLGDCLTILPTLGKVDAVITDPPYGMDLDTDFSKMSNPEIFKGKAGGNAYAEIVGDKFYDPQPVMTTLQDVDVQVWFGADYYSDRIPDRDGGSWDVWDKRLHESSDKMFGSCFEMMWSKQKRKREVFRVKWAGIFGTERQDVRDRVHPAQKPIELLQRVLLKHTEDGWTVLDPYMGSGSTGVACANLGRRFIGIEIEPRYFDIACERIENAQRQERLFA